MRDAKRQIFIEYIQLPFEQKITYIKCLKAISFQFKDETQPDAWIQSLIFTDISEFQMNPIGDICDIIETMFEINLICKETSICSRRYCTILDSMYSTLKTMQLMNIYPCNNTHMLLQVIAELIIRGAKTYEELTEKKVYVLEEELDMDCAFVVGKDYSFDA